MREETEAIRASYNASPQKEWNRLKVKHPFEKYITTHMMDRYIRPGDTILDIGGAPAIIPSITRGRAMPSRSWT